MNAIFGTASAIDPKELEVEFAPLLVEGERMTAAFKNVRDLFVFTQKRLILADKQGIPYTSISQFSVETAGIFDMDSELKIWISSNPLPLKKEFKKGADVVGLQKVLASYVLNR